MCSLGPAGWSGWDGLGCDGVGGSAWHVGRAGLGWAGWCENGLICLCLFTWMVSQQLITVIHIPIKHYVNIAKRTVSALSVPPCRGGVFV